MVTDCFPIKELFVADSRRGVRLFIVDPFIKSHCMEENRNEQIDFAATQWAAVTNEQTAWCCSFTTSVRGLA